jgi:protein phosphatase
VSSDGLHDLVADEEICDAVLNSDPEAACGRLINLARERGGHDNISVGVLAIHSPAEAAARSGAAGAREGSAP